LCGALDGFSTSQNAGKFSIFGMPKIFDFSALRFAQVV
jgi:hypothetical protein